MKILLVADGRSPITRGWIKTLREAGLDMALVSTFPCHPLPDSESPRIIPAAFSGLAGSQAGDKKDSSGSPSKRWISRFRGLFMAARYWLGPLSLERSRRLFLDIVEQEKPDIVHALRVPYEGMLARVTPPQLPFVASIWGNDLTLHAQGSPLMARETRQTLHRADGLIADAHRDLRLAKEWGLSADARTLCVPGSGGIDLTLINETTKSDLTIPLDIPVDVPLVINPRGFRPGSVRNDTFFKAILLVLKEIPETLFLCAGMANQPEALVWINRLGIERSVRLLPFLPQEDLWRLFKRARVSVSISQHDGTPNSLLEAMALGCYPVVGDIESTREWITDGINGRLVDPGDARAAAVAIIQGLQNTPLREQASITNKTIIAARANRQTLGPEIRDFYEKLILKRGDSE